MGAAEKEWQLDRFDEDSLSEEIAEYYIESKMILVESSFFFDCQKGRGCQLPNVTCFLCWLVFTSRGALVKLLFPARVRFSVRGYG